MDSLLYHSVSLTIELCKKKSMPALEALFASMSEVLEAEELTEYFETVAEQLHAHDEDLYEWFVEEIPSYIEYLELMEEMEMERLEEQFDEGEDREEVVYYITKQDLKHILLDEGLIEVVDFMDTGDELAISKKAKDVLEDYFDLELIEPIITLL